MKNTIYICKNCYDETGELTISFTDKHPAYGHAGFVFCEKCGMWDQYVNPTKEIVRMTQQIKRLNLSIKYYETIQKRLEQRKGCEDCGNYTLKYDDVCEGCPFANE